jgi:DNA-binding transcriptional LysR family regulator
LHTDGLIDTLAFVAGSDCLALLPAALLQSGLLRERLVVLPVADALPRYEVMLFVRRAVPLTPAAAELTRQLAREAEYLKRG